MLTNKEAKDILQSLKFIVDDYSDDVEEALNMAIKALEASAWIPVGEKLPDKPFPCIVTIMDENAYTGEVFENILFYFVGYDGEQWNDDDGLQCPYEVLAWMPLPEPYKGGDNNDG